MDSRNGCGCEARIVRSEYRVYAGPTGLSRLKAVLQTDERRKVVTLDFDPGLWTMNE